MAHQAGQFHAPGLGEADGARIGVLHAAAHDDREPLSPGRGVLERKPVVVRDAGHHKPAAVDEHFRGLIDGSVAPGGLDRNVHAPAAGGLPDLGDHISLIAAPGGGGSESLSQREAPRELVGHVDRVRSGQPHELKDAQPDRPRPENRHTMPDPDLGQVNRVDCHAERLQEDGRGVVQGIGNREARAGRHVHPLAQGPLIGPQPAEMQVQAQIRMPSLAQFALPARLGRIDRDPSARLQRPGLAVQPPFAHGLHDTAEFMAEDQRSFQPGIADPGYRLITGAIREGIKIESLPGASAFLSALVLSGLPTDRFVFEGFFPVKSGQKKTKLLSLKNERRTVIFYESPHRILKTLGILKEALGDIEIVVARELTKKFEEVLRKKTSEMIAYFSNKKVLGEFVVLFNLASQEH